MNSEYTYIKKFEADKLLISKGDCVVLYWEFTDYNGVLNINETQLHVERKNWQDFRLNEDTIITLNIIKDGLVIESKTLKISIESSDKRNALQEMTLPKFEIEQLPNFRRQYYDLITKQTPLPKLHNCPEYNAFKLLNSNKLVLEIENARLEVRKREYEPLQELIKLKGFSYLIELKNRILNLIGKA